MTRPRTVLATAVVAASLVLASPVLADEVGAVGWWTRSPSQQAPAGGFAVGAAPDGPVSVAAASVDLGADGVERASLRAVETGGLGQAVAALQVCPTDELWQPVAGGDLADAPTPDCERSSAPFERDEETATWQADVTGLVQDRTGSVGLMVVPAGSSDESAPATLFEVRFAAPSVDVVERTTPGPDGEATGQAGGAPPTSPAAERDAAPAPATGRGGTTTGNPPPAPPSRAGDARSDAVATPGSPDPTAPVAPETPGTEAVGAGGSSDQGAIVAAQEVRVARTDADGSRLGKAVLFVLLSAAVATGTALTQRWLRLR